MGVLWFAMPKGACIVQRETPTGAPLGETTDDDLMALAQAGSQEAFGVLVERHARRVVRLCRRFVGDSDLAAELAQATWVDLWFRRGQYRPDGQFVVWLITAARNRCRNHLRRRGVERKYALTVVAPDDGGSPEQNDDPLGADRRLRVRDALARLPDAMREALLLRFAEDLRYEEMAKIVRSGESTLRSRVHHGLQRLRQLLEKNK